VKQSAKILGLIRLLASRDGRLKSLGQDYDRGHRTYVEQVTPGDRLWLRTKPFSAPPSFELPKCFHTFAHLVDHLHLDVRAQVLDVGCGPGWLSEFLARCGYWVTGVDISEDMVEIARKRVADINEGTAALDPLAEFHATPVREMPWRDRFDAAVLYDSLHHFDDELETLRVIREALVPGGRIYIRDAVRPLPGSEGERGLREEMRRHGTLESPLESRYLVSVLQKAGFERVTRFAEVDELVDLGSLGQWMRLLELYAKQRLGRGVAQTVVAEAPLVPTLTGAANFAARIERTNQGWAKNGDELSIELKIVNVGRSFWPSRPLDPVAHGVVTVGPYVVKPDGRRAELPRTPLPHDVSSGGSASVEVRLPSSALEASDPVQVDLVREGLRWFEELGSKPATIVSLS
jgi:SAM-dependent methyltransferase